MVTTLRTFLLIASLSHIVVACGDQSNFKMIDDGQNDEHSQNQYSKPLGPIHSNLGWQSLVSLYVDEDAPELIQLATENAANSWNEAAGREVVKLVGRTEAIDQKSLFNVLEDSVTVVYFDPEWSKHTGKSAYVIGTTVWENDVNNNQIITRGDIVLNAQFYHFHDNTTEWSDESDADKVVDAQSVVLHELGHLLGLDHVTVDEDASSVMHAQAVVGPSFMQRELSAGDAERIRSIYTE